MTGGSGSAACEASDGSGISIVSTGGTGSAEGAGGSFARPNSRSNHWNIGGTLSHSPVVVPLLRDITVQHPSATGYHRLLEME